MKLLCGADPHGLYKWVTPCAPLAPGGTNADGSSNLLGRDVVLVMRADAVRVIELYGAEIFLDRWVSMRSLGTYAALGWVEPTSTTVPNDLPCAPIPGLAVPMAQSFVKRGSPSCSCLTWSVGILREKVSWLPGASHVKSVAGRGHAF
jgi:hypothetical protein